MAEKTKNPRPHRVRRIVLTVLGVLVGIVLVVVAGLNIYLRATYADFYAHARAEMAIPGTNDGFIVQDMDELPDGSWLFSGYEASGLASPLYRLLPDGTALRLTVTAPDGSVYEGHGSGVTHAGETVMLTQEDGYMTIPLASVLAAEDGGTVAATKDVNIGIDPAFLSVMDGELYAGVFYKAGPYDTPESMHIKTPDGTENPAVMFAYAPSGDGFATDPVRAYSIPGKVQGAALLDGELVLSQSWGAGASTLPVYDTEKLAQDGTYAVNGKDVPLFCLDGRSLEGTVTAPPMSEGLVAKDGRVWFPNESASNKYIFGKLTGSWFVEAVDVDGYLER